ncbi:hypothetical protein MTO96_017147 [Rhipicephalus appendiculatus]
MPAAEGAPMDGYEPSCPAIMCDAVDEGDAHSYVGQRPGHDSSSSAVPLVGTIFLDIASPPSSHRILERRGIGERHPRAPPRQEEKDETENSGRKTLQLRGAKAKVENWIGFCLRGTTSALGRRIVLCRH